MANQSRMGIGRMGGRREAGHRFLTATQYSEAFFFGLAPGLRLLTRKA